MQIKKSHKTLKIASFLTLSLSMFAALSYRPMANLEAASSKDFDPARIIDDAVFTDTTTMNASQVDAFLRSKLKTCDTNGEKLYNGKPRAEVSSKNPPPFVCLKDYTNSNTGQTAGEVIVEASREYGINPQVLLVLIEKEQRLVTDDWPWIYQYRTATGYGCPDTAACDEKYYGFKNQVNNAAKLLSAFTNRKSGYYIPFNTGKQFVQYHPSADCGGKTIDIKTNATAALYGYTPYQPNQAALDNLYGTGNSCSAYGNRNFWTLFTDWFGNTTSEYKEPVNPIYSAELFNRYKHESAVAGSESSASIWFKNTGTGIWYDETSSIQERKRKVLLFTDRPFANNNLLGFYWGKSGNVPGRNFAAVYEKDGRTLSENQHVAYPDQIVRYDIVFKIPVNVKSGDIFRNYFRMGLFQKSSSLTSDSGFLDVRVVEITSIR